MDKIKSLIKEYLRYFTIKRVSILLSIVIMTYVITTFGDIIQEKDLHLDILETTLYLIAMFGLTVTTLGYTLWKIIKKKELKLLELAANYTISMIYFIVIGGLVNVMVSKNIWIIHQRKDIWINGLEYALTMLANMICFTAITVFIIIVTLIIRVIKRSQKGHGKNRVD